MSLKKTINTLLIITVSLTLFACLDDSSTSNSGGANTGTVKLSGIIADPYIEGAVFCLDSNANKSCDSG